MVISEATIAKFCTLSIILFFKWWTSANFYSYFKCPITEKIGKVMLVHWGQFSLHNKPNFYLSISTFNVESTTSSKVVSIACNCHLCMIGNYVHNVFHGRQIHVYMQVQFHLCDMPIDGVTEHSFAAPWSSHAFDINDEQQVNFNGRNDIPANLNRHEKHRIY